MVAVPLERIVGLGLMGLGVYFAVLLTRGLAGYRRFQRVAPTAVVTWPAPPSPQLAWLVGLGLVGAAVAVFNAWLGRPLLHVLGLGAMALYFLLMVPLATRIRLGLYRDGVWADAGFIRWTEVARLAFRETPQIVLVLLPRHGRGSFRLPVPKAEYGTVRKLLEEKIRSGVLHLEPGLLGLS